jgi:hypothetical protein
MSCQNVTPQNGNSPTYREVLPKHLNKVHRLHMRVGHLEEAYTSDELVKLVSAIHEYLAQPEPWRSEYEKKYLGNL